MATTKRKGARSVKEIPSAILKDLNAGSIETVNLVEWLAVDQRLLLQNLLKQHHRSDWLSPILTDIDQLKKQTVNTVNKAIGEGLYREMTLRKDAEFAAITATHTADLVRCWSAYITCSNRKLSIQALLKQMMPFAADQHFGVREIAWLAARPFIAANLEQSIKVLTEWTSYTDSNIRRFASESTRPRGVWCEHIDSLKQDPSPALPILEPLCSDPARYVQDSIGNWLNDAAKTQPAFVTSLCKKWEKQSSTKETAYIIKKALRSID